MPYRSKSARQTARMQRAMLRRPHQSLNSVLIITLSSLGLFVARHAPVPNTPQLDVLLGAGQAGASPIVFRPLAVCVRVATISVPALSLPSLVTINFAWHLPLSGDVCLQNEHVRSQI
jgi:hypothetical protein